jgi:hypothetical protein
VNQPIKINDAKEAVANPVSKLPPDPDAKLQDVIDLPLGAVLRDREGCEFVFIGNRQNSSSLEFHFHPAMGQNLLGCNYSLVAGAFRKFPGLAEYVIAADGSTAREKGAEDEGSSHDVLRG